MSAAFTLTLTVGAWSTSFTYPEAADPADNAYVVDGLEASWDSDVNRWPSQPSPTDLSFSLWVPNVLDRPALEQGQVVELVILGPGHDPADPPFFEFYGRVTDLEGEPQAAGIRFDVTAVDFMAEPGEERLGAKPWPFESWWARWTRIVNKSRLPLELGTEPTSELVNSMNARDVDSQPAADVIEQLVSDVAIWDGKGFIVSWVERPDYQPRRWPWTTWARPLLCQKYAGAGVYTFALGYVRQDTLGGLDGTPYALTVDGAGVVSLTLRPPPLSATESAIHIPAAAAERKVRWRQDKAAATNRIRVTGQDMNLDGELYNEWTREYPAAVEQRGPVELTYSTDQSSIPHANAIALMYLGNDEYNATPRFTFDEITVRVEEISEAAAWPRLFPRADGTECPAPGRFVLVTGLAPEWNLYRRPDYPGRLVGAALSVDGGQIRATARILHRIPHLNGLDGQLSAAELAALPVQPTGADFGALTFADLRLVTPAP